MPEPMSEERLAQLSVAAHSPFPFDHPATQIVADAVAELVAEVKRLRTRLGEPEIQWGHQVHADDGHRGDEVPQTDERAARFAVAYLNKHTLPPDARAVVIRREVRIHEGPWRTVPPCECLHTCQPDGGLVRDGVLALGCPAHDPDTGGGDDELAGTEWM